MIELQNVWKKYAAVTALENVSLKIDPGEFVSLVGPSGAGKSTIVKLLILEERPTHGRVLVAGRDITRLSDRELPYYRRKVGVVFQDFKLLPTKTVSENVAYALEVCEARDEEIKSRVPKILNLVGMEHKASAYPRELSGGEQQRASIARAMVHSPRLLIADEPSGNLDPINTWEIMELLWRINQAGTVVILATHNKSIVDRLKKRVVVLRDGKVISDQKEGRYVL